MCAIDRFDGVSTHQGGACSSSGDPVASACHVVVHLRVSLLSRHDPELKEAAPMASANFVPFAPVLGELVSVQASRILHSLKAQLSRPI